MVGFRFGNLGVVEAQGKSCQIFLFAYMDIQPFYMSNGVIYLLTLRNGFLASFLVACHSAPGQP